jgi:Tfp pilus assembly protein PilO
MTTRRWWVIGCAVVMAVALGLGWLLGASPLLETARVADVAREGVEAQNLAYDQELTTLKEQFDGIGELEIQLAGLRTELPNGTALPAYVAQLATSAQQHSVTLTTITVGDAVAYTPPVTDGADPADTEAAPTDTATDAPPTDTATSPPATPAPDAVPATASVGAGTPVTSPLVTGDNFAAIPITIALDGGYANALDFVESLQKGTRLTTVTAFGTTKADAPATVVEDEDAPAQTPAPTDAVKGTISLYIYVLLGPPSAG